MKKVSLLGYAIFHFDVQAHRRESEVNVVVVLVDYKYMGLSHFEHKWVSHPVERNMGLNNF